MELQMSENINELAKALAAAQGALESVKRDKKNDHFNFKYADLAACLEVCREPLSKNGLAVIQIPSHYDSATKKINVATMLCHSSGQYIKGELEIIVTKPDAQGIGSAITYARRYSLCAMVGIAQDDDDANASCGIEPKQQQQPKQQQPAKAEQPEVITSTHNGGNVVYVNGNVCKVRNAEGQYFSVERLKTDMLKSLLAMEQYSAAHEAIKAVLEARSVQR